MTLGELQDSGQMPTPTQVFLLEAEVSKACGYNYGVHEYHCTPDSRYGGRGVSRVRCHRITALHQALRRMFPKIDLGAMQSANRQA